MPKTATRFARSVVLIVLLSAAWIEARAPTAHASPAAQPSTQSQVVGEGPNRAAIAVKFGDGRVETRCVAFSEDEIGGGDLLDRSGLGPAISPEGAVCSISGEGCAIDNCFCLCEDSSDCQYWAFYQWQGGDWVYSQFGVMANSVVVGNGSLHGWSWGAGDYNAGAPPPDVTFDQVCSASPAGGQSPLLPTPGSLVGGVPLAPTAEPSPLVTPSPQPTPTPYEFSQRLTETPRPRRVLGSEGGPTPTPLLLARAESGSGQVSTAKVGNSPAAGTGGSEPLAPSAASARSFSPDLLPGYAAYIATVAVLLVMAWYTLHRRNVRSQGGAAGRAEDEDRPRHTAGRE